MARKRAKQPEAKLKLMVSSTVYGIEDMLDQMYAFLHTAGFEVWRSHSGMRTPQWENTATGVRLTLFASTGDIALELNQRQRSLLGQIEPGIQFVTTEFHQRFASDIGLRQARKDLEQLEEFGFLSRSGTGRGTTYARTEKRLE